MRKCDSSFIKQIEEYNFKIITERKSRTIDRGGGVAIAFRKNIKFKKKSYKQYKPFESVGVWLETADESFVLTSLYYPGYSLKHKY